MAATRITPDLGFVGQLTASGGESLKKCFQCATCSVTCELAPDKAPFPRKEMIWAQWGLKDRLVANPDVWLCHQCNDCSTKCPRKARPGDVLAAVRRQGIAHFAVPGFLGKWVNDIRFLPLLVLIPAVLLGLAVMLRGPIENALGWSMFSENRIVYASTTLFPHWLLNSFFGFFSALALIAAVSGLVRFWGAMKRHDARGEPKTPSKGLLSCVGSVLKDVIVHNKFGMCTSDSSRSLSHLLAFYGFISLAVVAVWVITARLNPLFADEFVYPFNLFSPFKIIANLGGIALIAGCVMMIRDRLSQEKDEGRSTYADWALIGALLATVLTGFATEVFHYARVEPLQYAAYFVHLVCVFVLLMYLPYSKFAHLVYRTTALVYAEYNGREEAVAPQAGDAAPAKETEKENTAEKAEG